MSQETYSVCKLHQANHPIFVFAQYLTWFIFIYSDIYVFLFCDHYLSACKQDKTLLGYTPNIIWEVCFVRHKSTDVYNYRQLVSHRRYGFSPTPHIVWCACCNDMSHCVVFFNSLSRSCQWTPSQMIKEIYPQVCMSMWLTCQIEGHFLDDSTGNVCTIYSG